MKYILRILLFVCLLHNISCFLLVSMGGAIQVTSSHVYMEVQRANSIVDQLGMFMGIQAPQELQIEVKNVAPRDVYFQARTMVTKVNRLSFELLRKYYDLPELPQEVSSPMEVKKLVLESVSRLIGVAVEFGLPVLIPREDLGEKISPSDVFLSIMRVNRKLNTLLERRFSSADVYKMVNLSIGYASRLLTQYPGKERLAERPMYEKNKKPLDVYYRLHKCLLLIVEIYKKSEYDIFEFNVTKLNDNNVNPSDVFDLATLIVSRLDYLHRVNSIRRLPRETYFPGRKFPSDVFQQTGILEQQLSLLLTCIPEKRMSNQLVRDV